MDVPLFNQEQHLAKILCSSLFIFSSKSTALQVSNADLLMPNAKVGCMHLQATQVVQRPAIQLQCRSTLGGSQAGFILVDRQVLPLELIKYSVGVHSETWSTPRNNPLN